jgi:hypothetical protein
MAGYSGTPLAKKLGIQPNHRVALVDAPPDFEQTLGALPEGVALRRHASARDLVDVIVFFAANRSALMAGFRAHARRLQPAGGLWVAWPKKASGVATDLSEQVVRTVGLETGLVDNKVCAVDDTWSGLRFVIRRRDRPKPIKGRSAVSGKGC